MESKGGGERGGVRWGGCVGAHRRSETPANSTIPPSPPPPVQHANYSLCGSSVPPKVLASLHSHTSRDLPPPLDAHLRSKACHMSVRAGDSLSEGQPEDIIRGMEGQPFWDVCAHGRPTVVPGEVFL